MRDRFLGGLVLLLVVSGCGEVGDVGPASEPHASAPSSRPAGSTRPSLSTPGGQVVLLRNVDSGRTISLRVGQTATIMLGAADMDWSEAELTGEGVSVTAQVSDAATPARAWDVVAVAVGTAQVRVAGSPTCLATSPPCAAPDQLWSASFSVTD